MQMTGEPFRQAFSCGDKRLWLDVLEGFVSGVSLTIASLYPVWHTLRGLFGLTLLFHGDDFSTLAFHIVVFRISGWKKVSTATIAAVGRTLQCLAQLALTPYCKVTQN